MERPSVLCCMRWSLATSTLTALESVRQAPTPHCCGSPSAAPPNNIALLLTIFFWCTCAQIYIVVCMFDMVWVCLCVCARWDPDCNEHEIGRAFGKWFADHPREDIWVCCAGKRTHCCSYFADAPPSAGGGSLILVIWCWGFLVFVVMCALPATACGADHQQAVEQLSQEGTRP